MKSLFRKNLVFLIPQLFFVLISCFFIGLHSKPSIHFFLNQFHSNTADLFFKYITYLGDGMMYLFVLLFLLLRKYKWAIAFILAVVVSNFVVFIFKQVIFSDMYRPSKYFELFESYKLYLVPGVRLHSLNSFPSGHTTTAFTLFFAVAITLKKKGIKFLCFMLALLTGYSRVYLSQHFLVDVTFGSVLGSGAVLLAFHYSKYFKKPGLERALINSAKNNTSSDTPVASETPGMAV